MLRIDLYQSEVDGCSRWQACYKIILPLVGPGLIATGVYGWVLAWNEFVLANTLLLDNDEATLPIYLLYFQSSPVHGADCRASWPPPR